MQSRSTGVVKRSVALASAVLFLILVQQCDSDVEIAHPPEGMKQRFNAATSAELVHPEFLSAAPGVVESWKDMRVGMFICWGPVTLTGLEVGISRENRPTGPSGPTPKSTYDSLYKQWRPERFEASTWIKTAHEMGARYVVFLVKHQDGFCLYDTKLTDYSVTGPESAWHRDVLKDVADACHEAGIKLILYYSQVDYHHPDFKTADHQKYIDFLHGQIRELLTNYGRIDGLWFDCNGAADEWQSGKLFELARSLQPWLIMNDRIGLPGDYVTFDNWVNYFQRQPPWETNVTLNQQYAWQPQSRIRSLKECIQLLVVCACGDGNFVLNAGPKPDGQIEQSQVERFREIGAWLNKYGESIYNTRGGPLVAPNEKNRGVGNSFSFHIAEGNYWGGSTFRDSTIYVHILRWPADEIQLPLVGKKILNHTVLTGGSAKLRQTSDGVFISIPASQRSALDTIVKFDLDGPADDMPPTLHSGSLAYGKKTSASDSYSAFSPRFAVDDDDSTGWCALPGVRTASLEVDLGSAELVSRAIVREKYGRIRKFELQRFEADGWRTFFVGTTIGPNLELKFEPVRMQRVRLNIVECTFGPRIQEFQLFKK